SPGMRTIGRAMPRTCWPKATTSASHGPRTTSTTRPPPGTSASGQGRHASAAQTKTTRNATRPATGDIGAAAGDAGASAAGNMDRLYAPCRVIYNDSARARDPTLVLEIGQELRRARAIRRGDRVGVHEL